MPTILLVDDEPDILGAFQIALEARGYRVRLAPDGDAALRSVSRDLPDVIVTDWNMPGLDGVGLCMRLKSYPALAEVPVVMVSARSPPKGEPTPWNAFLRKPVALNRLEAVVEALCAPRRVATCRHVHSDRAGSRWQPVISKCEP